MTTSGSRDNGVPAKARWLALEIILAGLNPARELSPAQPLRTMMPARSNLLDRRREIGACDASSPPPMSIPKSPRPAPPLFPRLPAFGGLLARHVRKARLPRCSEAGGRRDHVRQSRHHRIAADGRVRNRERDTLPAGIAGSGRHGDGGRVCAGVGQARSGQSPRRARPRQRHGHALRRAEGGLAHSRDRGSARAEFQRHRADSLGRPSDHRAAVGQMVLGGAPPCRPAAAGAPRRQDRDGAADRAGIPVAARRHSARRRRCRPACSHARGAASARRSRGGRSGRGFARERAASGDHGRRRGGAEPRPRRTGRARGASRRAGVHRIRAEHGFVSGLASAVSRLHDSAGAGCAQGARPA